MQVNGWSVGQTQILTDIENFKVTGGVGAAYLCGSTFGWLFKPRRASAGTR
jgi:hypothetical protein